MNDSLALWKALHTVYYISISVYIYGCMCVFSKAELTWVDFIYILHLSKEIIHAVFIKHPLIVAFGILQHHWGHERSVLHTPLEDGQKPRMVRFCVCSLFLYLSRSVRWKVWLTWMMYSICTMIYCSSKSRLDKW